MGSWRHRLLGAFDFLLVSVALALAVNYASDASLPGSLSFLQRRPWALLGSVLALIALRGWQRWTDRANVWERAADPPDTWKHLLPELITRVRRDWIDGVLGPSLELLGEPVAVRLAQRADAVASPPSRLLAPANQPLPADADILAAYDYAQRRLLVLGTPGVGKTTALLSLADALLRRHASADRAPVVLHASTWAADDALFDVWVAKQLGRQYGLPARAAWSLVSHGLVIPLIDGVDELPQPNRGGFIAAVNRYQGAAHLYPLTVCCRLEEYEALPERLLLETAVEILPLTADDLDRWVEARGADRDVLHALLDGDPELRELATSPLMLGALAAAAADSVGLGALDREGKRGALLDAYVSRALTRTPRARLKNAVPADRLRADLVMLAGLMRSRGATVFSPGVLPAEWLPKRWQARCGVYAFDLVSLAVWTCLAWWHAPWNFTGGGPLPALAVLLFGAAFLLSELSQTEADHARGVKGPGIVAALVSEGVLIYALVLAHRDHPMLPYFVRTVLPLALTQPVLSVFVRILGIWVPGPVGLPRGAGQTGASVALAAFHGVCTWLKTVAGLSCVLLLYVAFVPTNLQTELWRLYIDELRDTFPDTVYDPAVLRSLGWTLAFLVLFSALLNRRVVSLLRGRLFRALLVRQRALPTDLSGLLEGARAHLLMHRSSGGYLFSHQLILEKLAQDSATTPPVPGPWRLDAVLIKPFLRAATLPVALLAAHLFGWLLVVVAATIYVAVVLPWTRWGIGFSMPIPRGTPIWRSRSSAWELAWTIRYSTRQAALDRKYGRLSGWQIVLIGAVSVIGIDFINWPGVGWLRFFSFMALAAAVFYSSASPDVKFVDASHYHPGQRDARLRKQHEAAKALLDDAPALERVALELGETIDAFCEFTVGFCALKAYSQPVVGVVRDAVHYGVGVSLATKRPSPIDKVALPLMPLERELAEGEADLVRYCAYIGYCIAVASPFGRRIFTNRLNRQSRALQQVVRN